MDHVITLGYDGSPASRCALEWAALEAEQRGAGVRVVHCVTAPLTLAAWPGSVASGLESLRHRTARQLAEAVGRVAERHPAVRFEPLVEVGPAASVLSAHTRHSELLVLGSTGAGRVESVPIGSVGHSVARRSQCAVVLVPDRPARPETGRIVVAVDGTEESDAAVDWATDEADRRGSELAVLHAWSCPIDTLVPIPTGRDLTRVDAALVLEAAVERSLDRGRSRVRPELVEDSPASALIGAAASADLVVVGARGGGRLRWALFGSVTQAVEERAICPLVVVPSSVVENGRSTRRWR